jgi:NAD(P)-dependent dehydrogenase (short-subunit alcohol dehydrogenase family)
VYPRTRSPRTGPGQVQDPALIELAWSRLYAQVREEAGCIDVLLANAGVVADAALGAN